MVLKPTPHVSGLSYAVVDFFFGHRVLPVHPNGLAAMGSECNPAAIRPEPKHVPALSSVRPVDVHVLSVHPVVCAFGYNKPSFLLVLFVDRVVAIDR